MNLVHVVPHISEEASGCSYAVPRLCNALANYGHQVELSCLAANDPIPGVKLDIHLQWPIFSRFAISHSHAISLNDKLYATDIVHNHSLWSMVNLTTGWIVPGSKCKLVVSPHGTLSSYALGRRKILKKVLWPFQKRILAKSDLIHATSQVEYEQIRENGFTAPVAIIPNGIDLPIITKEPCREKKRSLIFLSRLHPIKCVENLLYAWKKIQFRHLDWNLFVFGKGEPVYVRKLIKLASDLQLKRIAFPGPVYGEEKKRAYLLADLFVLPSCSENFGMVVAEALAHECPTIVSQGAPWAGLQTEDCGWWIKHDVETLAVTLDEAMSTPIERLKKMGNNGRDWMEREYGWESIAGRMDASYRWVLDGGERPDWIKVD